MPAPKNLSEDQKMDYLDYLAEQAQPISEKAITSIEGALALAHNNGVYNEWSKKAAKLLVEIDPGRFPVLSDEIVNTEYSTAATFSTKPVSNAGTKLNRNPPPPPPPPEPEPASAETGTKGKGSKGDTPTEVME